VRDFKLLINGQLVEGDLSMPVLNPATATEFAQCPRASREQLDQAVAAAKAAFPAWSATSIGERRAALTAIADKVEQQGEDFAQLLTLEQGKPLAAARIEVAATVMFLRYFAGLDLPDKEIRAGRTRHALLRRRPLGVVAVITAWNFPLLLLAFKAPAALLAGNTIVVKPAPTTPLSALRFGEIAATLLPPGVFNVITDANDLGPFLTSHPDVRKVTFTGSTATGRQVMASAAQSLKRLTLELGGNDAAIVLDDADPKAVARRVFDSAFQNSGQLCVAIKRLYVHDSIYDAMCDELATLANQAVVGDGQQPETTLGPVQNRAQFDRLRLLLEDTKTKGKVIAGGAALPGPGYFIAPTIVRDIAEGSRLVDEEQFGPVLPVIRYSDPQDAVRRANASELALGASVWSSDPQRAGALAAQLDAGQVGVNIHPIPTAHVPFAGAKQSGIGVELGEEGLAEFTQLQVLNLPD
jgi:acyl-CoA reductase-like NAD-dependent aldehyde dehydrogenase